MAFDAHCQVFLCRDSRRWRGSLPWSNCARRVCRRCGVVLFVPAMCRRARFGCCRSFRHASVRRWGTPGRGRPGQTLKLQLRRSVYSVGRARVHRLVGRWRWRRGTHWPLETCGAGWCRAFKERLLPLKVRCLQAREDHGISLHIASTRKRVLRINI